MAISTGNIKEHYKVIGTSLISLEKDMGIYAYIFKDQPTTIQTDLAFIQTEILNSYLEDLLDFTISDEKLFIYRKNLSRIYNLVAILGLVIAMGLAINLAYQNYSLTLIVSLFFLISIPCALVWHLSPKLAPNRRLFFAKIISNEISRREGIDSDTGLATTRIRLSKLMKMPKTMPELTKVRLEDFYLLKK